MDNEIIDDDIFTQSEDPTPTVENYTEDNIVHLEDMEHVRLRPGMYIGKLGDGASQDDGIYGSRRRTPPRATRSCSAKATRRNTT